MLADSLHEVKQVLQTYRPHPHFPTYVSPEGFKNMYPFKWSAEALRISAARRRARREEEQLDAVNGIDDEHEAEPHSVGVAEIQGSPQGVTGIDDEHEAQPHSVGVAEIEGSPQAVTGIDEEHQAQSHSVGDAEIEVSPQGVTSNRTAPAKVSSSSEGPREYHASHAQLDAMLFPLRGSQRLVLLLEDFTQTVGQDTIKIPSADFSKILNNDWLSTEVMEAFVFRVNERSRKNSLRHFVLSPDFLRCLNHVPGNKKKPKYDYSNVEKCLSKRDVNIEELGSMMVPTCIRENHWVLVILDFTAKTVVYYDPLSQRSKGEEIIGILKRWVRDEVGKARGRGYALKNFKNSSWKHVDDLSFPMQEDSRSCGLFVLYLVEFLTRENFTERKGALSASRPSFSQEVMCNLRERLIYIIKKGFA